MGMISLSRYNSLVRCGGEHVQGQPAEASDCGLAPTARSQLGVIEVRPAARLISGLLGFFNKNSDIPEIIFNSTVSWYI